MAIYDPEKLILELIFQMFQDSVKGDVQKHTATTAANSGLRHIFLVTACG